MPDLLPTKFHPPAPPARHVARPHLVLRLNEGLDLGRRLTLISAPAGFGKTTCVIEWAAALDRPMAWLALDPADDDPLRFFSYLVAALQRLDPRLGAEIAPLLQAGQLPPAETLASHLVNDLAQLEAPALLVLDDFHSIQENLILSWMGQFITNLPPSLHPVIVTREDPLLPLARLRAHDLLTELRSADLRFNRPEAGSFLAQIVGQALPEDALETLESRTEGWAVGLQLAGLTMRGHPDPERFIATLSGSHRYILSYLTEEVLGRQSPEIQSFLLQTSILGKLNGDLCDAVTGRADSRQLLERLYQANLFLIPLDDEQEWYRYHHLFADLLRSQQARQAPAKTSQLHRRAGAWYASAGMPGEAIEHTLQGKDYAAAIQLLEQNAMQLLTQGSLKQVEAWLQAVPPEWRLQSPRANLALAWLYLLRGDYAQTRPYAQQAEAGLQHLGPNVPDAADVWADLYALQSNLLHVQGQAEASIEKARLALQHASPENLYVRGSAYLGLGGAYRQAEAYEQAVEAYQKTIEFARLGHNLISEMLAATALTLMSIQHGQYHFARQVAQQTIQQVEESAAAPPPIVGAVYGALAMVHYEWGEFEPARQYLQKGLRLGQLSGHNASLVFSQLTVARLAQAEGQPEAAQAAMRNAAELLQRGAPAWLKPEVVYQQVRLYLEQNQPGQAENVLRQSGLPALDVYQKDTQPVSIPAAAAEPGALADLRLQLHTLHSRQELQALLEPSANLLQTALIGQRLGSALQAYLLRARVYLKLGEPTAAQAELQQAVELAAPQNLVRSFVDEYTGDPALAPALAAALGDVLARRPDLASGLQRLYEKLLKDVHRPAAGAASPSAAVAEALIEPLTERELDVLRLMADGMTYEQISERLIVSINTVRFHVKMLYGKLQANNRTQALEIARRFGLL